MLISLILEVLLQGSGKIFFKSISGSKKKINNLIESLFKEDELIDLKNKKKI